MPFTGAAIFVLNKQAADCHPDRECVHCRRHLQQGPEPCSPTCQPCQRHRGVKTPAVTAGISAAAQDIGLVMDPWPCTHVKQELHWAVLSLDII